MMQQETTSIITIKATGERCRLYKRLSWNRVYYSLDHGLTWHRTKTAAYKAAGANLAVIGKPITMPDGSTMAAQ